MVPRSISYYNILLCHTLLSSFVLHYLTCLRTSNKHEQWAIGLLCLCLFLFLFSFSFCDCDLALNLERQIIWYYHFMMLTKHILYYHACYRFMMRQREGMSCQVGEINELNCCCPKTSRAFIFLQFPLLLVGLTGVYHLQSTIFFQLDHALPPLTHKTLNIPAFIVKPTQAIGN